MIETIHTQTPPGATLVGIPDGILVNFLERRLNPTPYLCFGEHEMFAFGGEAVTLETLKRQSPDYVLLVRRDMTEYNRDLFGVDPVYGKQILTWLEEAYEPVKTFGASPFDKERFGALLWRRKKHPS